MHSSWICRSKGEFVKCRVLAEGNDGCGDILL